ncbi:MAG: bifunctional 2-polyprenyl-6-hydroxyphenol methylase/3-demethylubiquinol 3-O-methyltransferase UbiG [Gammaproteobacteria bacterium]
MKAQTINPQEVAYYDRLADQWWDNRGIFWPLHRLNELRAGFLKRKLCSHFGRCPENDSPLAGLSIIDIGCGGGILSESMAALGASVHGIDVVEKNIRVAKKHSQQNCLSIHYELIDVEELNKRHLKYDVVLNMEVVEHVDALPVFVKACTQLVARDGIMFIATINRNLLSWLFAIVGAEYILGWLPKGTHSWHKFVRPKELESLLSANGLRVTSGAGVRINPITRNFSISKRLQVNYMLSAVINAADR